VSLFSTGTFQAGHSSRAKRYDTEEAFREALLTFTHATEQGCNYTLGLLAEGGWIVVDARLTEAGRKVFGVEDDKRFETP
jgi:hypothetical protein